MPWTRANVTHDNRTRISVRLKLCLEEQLRLNVLSAKKLSKGQILNGELPSFLLHVNARNAEVSVLCPDGHSGNCLYIRKSGNPLKSLGKIRIEHVCQTLNTFAKP